jgi:hypothetical protein
MAAIPSDRIGNGLLDGAKFQLKLLFALRVNEMTSSRLLAHEPHRRQTEQDGLAADLCVEFLPPPANTEAGKASCVSAS